MPRGKTMNVCEYLLKRLKSLGADHAFGVPGDFILPFFECLSASDITHIATCNELNAGYAADGYARLKGIGVAVVTYGPGSFSVVNAIAGAHAEDVPLVVISGGPPTSAYRASPNPVLHHMLTDNYGASIKVFEQVCEHAVLLDNPGTVITEIDRALDICISRKKPVFLEVPRDIQLLDIAADQPGIKASSTGTNDEATTQALSVLIDRITQSSRTVILPGHEIHRWQLQHRLVELLEKTGIAAASMFVGKAEFLEHLPQCLGSYQGAASQEDVRTYVEEADTVVYLGAVPSDLNLGGFTAKLSGEQTVTAWNNRLEMSEGSFENISIVDVIDGLATGLPANLMNDTSRPVQSFMHRPGRDYEVEPHAAVTSQRFYDRLADFFRPNDIVLADASCAFNLAHTQFPEKTEFIASNYWASIGMGFGAALGACFAAADKQRVIAVEGDGSFQMTAQELSSMIRYGMSPIVIVINNQGYTAERFIHDGEFNDIPQWQYHKLPETFGGGIGIEVRTEGELEMALEQASASAGDKLVLIEVHIDAYDVSDGFRTLCAAFRGH